MRSESVLPVSGFKSPVWLMPLAIGLSACLALAALVLLQQKLDQVQDRTTVQIQELANLPRGEYLKPAVLGYQHLAADLLWLSLVQVVGKKRNSTDEYEWMYHALDVITTLDPRYAYAYYTGGIVLGDLARRPDLSNRLLLKGTEANPTVWTLPFLLGYNYYFLLGDAEEGAKYIMRASTLPDRPAYLPGLATRLAAEGGKPETALAFLEARLLETQDPQMREFFVDRMKEVIIERDVQLLQKAVDAYQMKHHSLPATLKDLVTDGLLSDLPREVYGGHYVLDAQTGLVASSTHPKRLRTFFKRKQPPLYLFPKTEPAYVFPRTWE